MKIFIDKDFKCNIYDDGTMIAVESDFFDGKCAEFIEGYRFVPDGKSWIRSDGEVFNGEMVSPWKDYSELDVVQREYEKQQFNEYKDSLLELGVEL